MLKPKYRFFLLALLSLSLFSCKSIKKFDDFELASKISDPNAHAVKIYMTGSKPIDSVDQSKLIFDIWKIDAKDYPKSVKLFARVMDSSGIFVNHLAAPYSDKSSQFWTGLIEELKRRGSKSRFSKIDTFSVREFGEQDSIPYSIMLTLDYSGSMEDVKQPLFDGAELFINMKMKYDRISVAGFSKTFDIKSPFYQSKEAILSDFRAKRDQGFGWYSALNDGIKGSIEELAQQPKEEPRILVIFTDGNENASKSTLSECYKMAKEENINIFIVGYGFTDDEGLKSIAEYTGGKYYKAYSAAELKAIFSDIYRSLRNYYLITYSAPEYYGLHKVELDFNAPLRSDTLKAYAEYDKSMFNIFSDTSSVFSALIQFDFAKAELKPESKPILDQLADNLDRFSTIKLEIRGNTDNIGGVDFNQKLSEERAKVVMDALIARGVEPKRLRSRGFGMSMPLVVNDSEENRAKNRRTEFLVIAR